MCDHFVLHCLPHQYLCGTTLYSTVYLTSTYVGPLCIVSVPMWDHFVLHYLLHQCLRGPLCIASVPMWDHFVLHCLPHQYLCGTTCISTYVGPLCIATVGICLISRPTYMWDHFVLHCLHHQYLCGTTLYCIDHFVLHQYLCGTTLHCTVYLTSTYVGPHCIVSVPMWDHFVLHCLLHQYLRGPLCIVSVPMWDHFVLHCLPHQYLCGTTVYCNSRYMPHQYVGPLCIAL